MGVCEDLLATWLRACVIEYLLWSAQNTLDEDPDVVATLVVSVKDDQSRATRAQES